MDYLGSHLKYSIVVAYQTIHVTYFFYSSLYFEVELLLHTTQVIVDISIRSPKAETGCAQI